MKQKTFKIYDGDATLSFEIDEEKKNNIVEKIINFCLDNQCFCGEILMQDDDLLLESPNLISDIIDDIIEFKVKWNNE
jgi:hypothetical protein